MTILQTVTPVTHDLGGFKVRRAIPSPQLSMVGPFVFVDQFGPARLAPGQGMDVRPHPHINLATVTWLFEGAIDHRDSIGSFSTIHPGTVNLMTAGAGIVHSERSPETERVGGPALYGMQTWLALPDGREELDPAFEAISALPLVEDDCVKAQVIMGELWGRRAPTTCYAETILAALRWGRRIRRCTSNLSGAGRLRPPAKWRSSPSAAATWRRWICPTRPKPCA